ncbi:hypothetical protein E2493_06720 [Sphingomonas parva]|uniref:Alpha/beta hydrolase n=1 Tax=Sphingomonas parva TaxID=2555898 RepID=A0A4Y8ZSD1_9SPHN|nr:hypothetical protein [Sphingomonas parva]TFI58948.1 hypothetical protein E2493_06720 [Sphingomonas parva]
MGCLTVGGGKDLAVLVLHGIGTYSGQGRMKRKGFDQPLRAALESRLGADFQRIAWCPITWSAPALERRQDALIRERGTPFPWSGLFEFVSSFLSDATAHNLPLYGEMNESSSYFIVQQLIRGALVELEAQLGPAAESMPVLAIAHSMGCHVLSCYAWDARHAPERILGGNAPELGPLTRFQALETLSGLVFVGCNLPLLTTNVARQRLLPLRLPRRPAALGGGRESLWLNIWEKNDPLGYPLSNEYEAYFSGGFDAEELARWKRDPASEQRPQDIEVKFGGLAGATPLAHTAYYHSRRVQKRITDVVKALLG